jgi:hypothetical protein
MFLEAEPPMFDAQSHSLARLRLQWLYSYLETPAPIDAAKAALGFSCDARLARFLHFHARAMGLVTAEVMPEIWNLADPRTSALTIVKLAMKETGRERCPMPSP